MAQSETPLDPVLDAAAVEAFQRDGFVNGGPFLDPDEVAELRDELTAIVEAGPDAFETEDLPVLFRDLGRAARSQPEEDGRTVWQVVNVWQLSASFRRLLSHPKILSAVSQLTGSDLLQVWHDQAQVKPPHGGCTTWHQDAPLWRSIEPPNQVTAWIALDDVDVDNGALWMVPGSHRWGDRLEFLMGEPQRLHDASEFGNLGEFVPPLPAARACRARAGEVHFHHSLTWHGSPDNTTDRPRHALGIHYMPEGVRYSGRTHVISRFIRAAVDAPMTEAGPAFPVVLREGRPVPVPG